MISSILVRADAFQNRVIFANNVLSHSCQECKMELIKHNNINFELLYNDRHLRRYEGFPIFLRNIRVALFGTEALQLRRQT